MRRPLPAREARWILEAVVGRPAPAGPPDDAQRAQILEMARRRRAGEPLQYVIGEWAFWDLELCVDRRALIPRPETEQVVEVALAALGPTGSVVVDLGTGSGAIALALAHELAPARPDLRVWATDVDQDALDLAGENLARVPGAQAGAVRLARGDWFCALPETLRGRVDLVVANPPYVSEGEWGSLDPEVRLEPRGALVSADGSDATPGFACVEAVLTGAPEWLSPGGAVVVELSPPQVPAARSLARRVGLVDVRVERDLAGRERMVVGRR